jgi:hypothetical protein
MTVKGPAPFSVSTRPAAVHGGDEGLEGAGGDGGVNDIMRHGKILRVTSRRITWFRHGIAEHRNKTDLMVKHMPRASEISGATVLAPPKCGAL